MLSVFLRGGCCINEAAALRCNMHRSTLYRRKKGITKRPVDFPIQTGRHTRTIERERASLFLNFTKAVVGELAEQGKARLWNLKKYPSDGTGGPPTWRPCRLSQGKKIEKSSYSPVIMAIAAAELARFRIGGGGTVEAKEVVDFYKANPKLIGIPAENPEDNLDDSRCSGVTKKNYTRATGKGVAAGGKNLRLILKPSPLNRVFNHVGIDISPRMVCLYREKPEFCLCKEWLRKVVARPITRHPARGDVVIMQDVTFKALAETSKKKKKKHTKKKEVPVLLKTEVAALHQRARKIQNGKKWKEVDERVKEITGLSLGRVSGEEKPSKKKKVPKPTQTPTELGMAIEFRNDGGRKIVEVDHRTPRDEVADRMDTKEEMEADKNNPYLQNLGIV